MKALLLAISIICGLQAQTAGAQWDPKAAATYLDGRMSWWETWSTSQRDHGTFCVSCHTAMPYALARPALRGPLGETSLSATEHTFIDNMSKRVAMWQEVQPFYNESRGAGKSAESRATEAVLNALVLTRYDAPAAPDALRNMWALQLKTGDNRGAWTWLNFHNEPWEADDSAFWGASLAGIAAGWTSEKYRSSPEIQENIALLAGYMQREQQNQATLHRAVGLWASGNLPQLLKPEQREAIVADIASKQREDGGWAASSLVIKNWKRSDGTPMDTVSDGYATGLMTIALEQSRLASAKPAIAKGLAWLKHHQDASGAWLSTSLNKKRDPASDPGRFMSDAGTSYTVLALSADQKELFSHATQPKTEKSRQ